MDIVAALARLDRFGSPDAIAQYLTDIGCTGDRNSTVACPIARYVAAEAGEDAVDVDPDQCVFSEEMDEDGMPPAVANPRNVTRFIEQFDAGAYPRLIGDPG